MHSFEKLSLLFLFVAFGKYVHAQTTSLYIPSVSDSGGLNLGVSLMASIVDTGGGATVYQIFLGTSEDQADNGPDSTLTLSEGSSTAHMFGSMIDEGVTMSIDIQCNINGDASSCTETDLLMSGTASATSTVSTFTETVSLVPVTLVSALPGASGTSNLVQPTTSLSGSSDSTGNSASSPSASSPGNPSIPAPSGGSSPAPTPSPTGSTNSSSSSPNTLNPPNSANSRIMSTSLLVLPFIILPMLF